MLAQWAAKHRMDMLNTILEPVIVMLGGEFKEGATESEAGKKPGGKKRKPRKKSKASGERTLTLSEIDEAGQEDALMAALTRASHQGVAKSQVSITSVRASKDEPG